MNMNKMYLLCLILFIAIGSVWSQPVSNNAASKIMIVNSYSKAIFIRLTDPKHVVVLQTPAIAAEDISYMLSTPKTGGYFIWYKYNETDDWIPFSDNSDEESYSGYEINLAKGLVCCIVITGDGEMDEQTLVLPESDKPLVCFCNVSGTTLGRMEIGTDYMNNFVAYTLNRKSMGMTDFTAIDPGKYGLFWATAAAAANDQYVWLPDDNDATFLRLLPFVNNHFYVFCVFSKDATNAFLSDITPK
jgi:hypothetical protein